MPGSRRTPRSRCRSGRRCSRRAARRALADDPDAVRGMLRLMRQNLAAMPTPPVPRGFVALQTLPEGLLVAMLRRFLRSPTAAHSGLNNASPAHEAAELERLAEQMRPDRGRRPAAGHRSSRPDRRSPACGHQDEETAGGCAQSAARSDTVTPSVSRPTVTPTPNGWEPRETHGSDQVVAAGGPATNAAVTFSRLGGASSALPRSRQPASPALKSEVSRMNSSVVPDCSTKLS
jgi:hypothetical protein